MDLVQFFNQVATISGRNIKLDWSSEFAFTGNRCDVWHCQVLIDGNPYRCNVCPTDHTPYEFARALNHIGHSTLCP